jgi:hypothetical protein
MKTLKKEEMLKKEQVMAFSHSDKFTPPSLTLFGRVACARTCRARRSGGIQFTLGGATLLLVPRSSIPVLDHGISSRGRPDDDAH